MDIFSMDFVYALGAIVLIDLVLAGDNALVIAMAARRLPPIDQKKAILWGTVGAILVRSAMTLAVVWLLKIPGLLLIGGALLVWISIKLLAPEDHAPGDDSSHAPSSFIGAMKTIVIADAVMGIDNVLGVAAAAKGSMPLLVIGLAISIPLVIFGATMLLKIMERFPIIITIGGGLLGWVAGEMAISDPAVVEWIHANVPQLHTWFIGPIIGTAFVLIVGKIMGNKSEHAAT